MSTEAYRTEVQQTMFHWIGPEVYLLNDPLHVKLLKATRLKINYVYCMNQLLTLPQKVQKIYL